MSHNEMTQLKTAVLQAVLNRQVLPGSQELVSFPDLALLLNQPHIYILDQEIGSAMSQLNKDLLSVSANELDRLAKTNAAVYYLQFQEERMEDGTVNLKLILQLKTSTDNPVPLSQIHLPYKKSAEAWQLSGQPAALSS